MIKWLIADNLKLDMEISKGYLNSNYNILIGDKVILKICLIKKEYSFAHTNEKGVNE